MILKTVTVQEANGLLPLVREHFFRIHMMLAHLQQLREKLAKKTPRFIFDRKSESILVIKRKGQNKKYRACERKVKEIEQLIGLEVNDLMRLGAVIKSLVPPHIDFLSMKNQEPIFLCWHGGETEISHWHYLDDNSPLRQMIDRGHRFGNPMVH